MWHTGQTPLQMRVMISEVVSICEAEKNHSSISSFQFTDTGDPLNFQRLKGITLYTMIGNSWTLHQWFSIDVSGFTPGWWHGQNSDKSQPHTYHPFSMSAIKSWEPCSRWSPRSPTDLRVCDSNDADYHTLVLCSQGHAIGATFHKQDGIELLHVLWRVSKGCSLYIQNRARLLFPNPSMKSLLKDP